MSTVNRFDVEWVNKNLRDDLTINILTNEKIGTVGIPMGGLQFYTEWEPTDYYKILTLIREKTLYGKPYLVYLKNEREKIKSLDLNEYTVISKEELLNNFPKNIIEIQQRSLMLLYKLFPQYGQHIKIGNYNLFSKDGEELSFIQSLMMKKNFITNETVRPMLGDPVTTQFLIIGEEGWLEIQKNSEYTYSKQVFVAMWFDDKMDNAYLAIERAVKDCGLNVIRIDRKEHNKEISGEILSEIKNSTIVIADVTGQRNGVYFEAGFALGHQKDVIWSVKQNQLKKVHFDTRQYSHVVWQDEDDLYSKMKNRILATLAIRDK
jgi:nucleoside 2-deoxyribosyltransferase